MPRATRVVRWIAGLVVDADSVHRIQETQAGLGFALWQSVQARLSKMEDGNDSLG